MKSITEFISENIINESSENVIHLTGTDKIDTRDIFKHKRDLMTVLSGRAKVKFKNDAATIEFDDNMLLVIIQIVCQFFKMTLGVDDYDEVMKCIRTSQFSNDTMRNYNIDALVMHNLK